MLTYHPMRGERDVQCAVNQALPCFRSTKHHIEVDKTQQPIVYLKHGSTCVDLAHGTVQTGHSSDTKCLTILCQHIMFALFVSPVSDSVIVF